MNITIKHARRTVMNDLLAMCSHRSMANTVIINTVMLEKRVAQLFTRLGCCQECSYDGPLTHLQHKRPGDESSTKVSKSRSSDQNVRRSSERRVPPYCRQN